MFEMHHGTSLGLHSFIFTISDVSPQVRVKILGKLSEETKAPLMKLHNCLNGKVSLFPVSYIISCFGIRSKTEI